MFRVASNVYRAAAHGRRGHGGRHGTARVAKAVLVGAIPR